MTIFVTSDIHLAHLNILRYCPARAARFADVDHMNEGIIKYWQDTVKPDDTIYVLGDLAMGHRERFESFISRLTGKIHLITGNHDHTLVKKMPELHKYFEEITPYKEKYVADTLVCMFHFPIAHWHKSGDGSIHLHGHLHGDASGLLGRVKDVGIDGHPNFEFYVLDDLVSEMQKVEHQRYHHTEK